MGVVNMAKTIKQIHPNYVVCFKVGKFYNVYGKDAYIIAYLFSYKVNFVENDIPTCGFPLAKLPKAIAVMENKKINYLLIDTRNNYDVDEKSDNKNLNTYEEVFEKSHKIIRAKTRIEKIAEELIKGIEKEEFKEKIKKVEEIVYETGKV